MIHVRACEKFDPRWEAKQVVQKAKPAKAIFLTHKLAKWYKHGELSEGRCTYWEARRVASFHGRNFGHQWPFSSEPSILLSSENKTSLLIFPLSILEVYYFYTNKSGKTQAVASPLSLPTWQSLDIIHGRAPLINLLVSISSSLTWSNFTDEQVSMSQVWHLAIFCQQRYLLPMLSHSPRTVINHSSWEVRMKRDLALHRSRRTVNCNTLIAQSAL